MYQRPRSQRCLRGLQDKCLRWWRLSNANRSPERKLGVWEREIDIRRVCCHRYRWGRRVPQEWRWPRQSVLHIDDLWDRRVPKQGVYGWELHSNWYEKSHGDHIHMEHLHLSWKQMVYYNWGKTFDEWISSGWPSIFCHTVLKNEISNNIIDF